MPQITADMQDEDQPRRPPQTWRSQASSNWRVKDESPRAEQPQRSHNRSFEPRRDDGGEQSVDATPTTRLYVGNLLYSAQPEDVEQLFKDHDFTPTKINMSVDPFTGRNPSYCFVDFETAEEANRAMTELNMTAEILGRPVKINPGIAKKGFGSQGTAKKFDRGWQGRDGASPTTRSSNDSYKPTFDRWSRTDPQQHWKGSSEEGKRLYVGGLPRIDSQSTVEQEMQALFTGFTLTAVSKIISPHPSKASEPGNHYFLFVDMDSKESAEQAIAKLNGTEAPWGGKLRVNMARGDSRRGNKEQLPNETDRL